MHKGLFVISVVIILVSVTLSGCQDTNSVMTQKAPDNVLLDSTIVEFVNVSFDKKINKSGGVESVTVTWLFHVIAEIGPEETISGDIVVKFCDNKNTVLYTVKKYFNDYPAGYKEQFLPAFNKITYDGADAAFVDHVVISVTEKKP